MGSADHYAATANPIGVPLPDGVPLCSLQHTWGQVRDAIIGPSLLIAETWGCKGQILELEAMTVPLNSPISTPCLPCGFGAAIWLQMASPPLETCKDVKRIDSSRVK